MVRDFQGRVTPSSFDATSFRPISPEAIAYWNFRARVNPNATPQLEGDALERELGNQETRVWLRRVFVDFDVTDVPGGLIERIADVVSALRSEVERLST